LILIGKRQKDKTGISTILSSFSRFYSALMVGFTVS